MARAYETTANRMVASPWPKGNHTTPNTHVTLPPTIMSTQVEDDYDKLSPEEREIRDKADRQREADEQAGMSFVPLPSFSTLSIPKSSLIPGNNLCKMLMS
jgi:hypothetical protein